MKMNYFVKKYILTPLIRSIRMKLFILTFSVGIVPLVVAIIISWQNSQGAMEQEILNQNNSKMEWVNSEFKNNIKKIDDSLTSFYFDSNIQFYNTKVEDGDNWQKEGVEFFRTKLRSYLLANYADFKTVQYYTFESNKVFTASYEKDFLVDYISENELEINPLFKNEKGLFYLIDTIEEGPKIKGPFITKLYRRFDNQEIINALVVELNWNLYEGAAQLLLSEEGSRVFFFDNDGRVIYHINSDETAQDIRNTKNVSNSQNQVEDLFTLVKNSEDGQYRVFNDEYVFFSKISDDLYFVKTLPTSIATDFYKKTLSSQLFIIMLTGIVIVFIILFFGSQLTRPIIALTRSMQNIDSVLLEEKLPETISKSNDEIKVMEQSYLFMISKIKNLIDKEFKQQIEIQSAQLMALQAQINPHFMYNTLQMIGAMAVDKGADEVYNSISAFSKMLRYNMQFTENMVTCEQEIVNVKQYLHIQQKRFEEKLSVTFDIDEETLNYQLPKLSIQPIVENCFKYGFAKSKEKWVIKIKSWQENNAFYISIFDNGQGIDQERLTFIRNHFNISEPNTFYENENLGLKNIDSRIKICFGKGYGLKVESNEGEFSLITMCMKAIKKDVNS